MKNAISEILEEIYPGENVALYEPRFRLLYQLLFEIAKPDEKEQLKREIIFCECHYVEDTRARYAQFANVTPQLLLNTYAGVAFQLAMARWESKEPQLSAKYLSMIYSQFMESPHFVQYRKSQARLISETTMDFLYASGQTDCMSFRLHDWTS